MSVKENERYSGVISDAGSKGYCFIHGVKTMGGTPVDTNGDVFAHKTEGREDCFVIGNHVTFELTDSKEEPGRYAAINIAEDDRCVLESSHLLSPILTGAAAMADADLPKRFDNGEPAYIYLQQPQVPPALVSAAANCWPLEGINRPTAQDAMNGKSMADQLTQYLKSRYGDLMQAGLELQFDITDTIADETERKSIRGYQEKCSDANIRQDGLKRRLEKFHTERHLFRRLYEAGLLHPHAVMPIEMLPHFVAAAPVWYTQTKKEHLETEEGEGRHPKLDWLTANICKNANSVPLGYLLQLFNMRPAAQEQYEGEIIPPHILEMMGKAKAIQDESMQAMPYIVIATPYLHKAGWRSPKRKERRSCVDPFLLAFSFYTPKLFYVLGRFSNAGIHAGIEHMIADTAMFIEELTPDIETETQTRKMWRTPQADSGVKPEDIKGELADFCRNYAWYLRQGNLLDWLTGYDVPPRHANNTPPPTEDASANAPSGT